MALRRVVSDWGIPFGLACMVVTFAVGSAGDPGIKRMGHDAKWVVLIVLCAAAAFEAVRRLWRARSLPPTGLLRFAWLAGAFLALAIVSTAWSVAPRLTFEHAASVGFLFVLAAALASLTAADTGARVRLFEGLAVGAVAVGVLSVGVLVFDYNTAVQQASASSAWRYRGFTENPNTLAILAGVALPIIVALAIRSRRRRQQMGWLAAVLLMLASIIATESRGGLLAACAGTLVVAALGVEGLRHRGVAVAALLLVFGGGIALRQHLQPPAPPFSSEVAPAPTPVIAQPHAKPHRSKPSTRAKGHGTGTGTGSGHAKPGKGGKATPGSGTKRAKKKVRRHKAHGPKPIVKLYTKTQPLPNEQDEIGHPLLSKQATSTVGSGRLAAWGGALELIGDRPILGYGFGTEQKVFIDRWYFFQGTTENSYLGLLLEVGGIGLALVLAMGCALGVGGFRALRTTEGEERVLVVASLGVLVAAAVTMLIQSYLYSVGNVATATVWISLFALAPIALTPRTAPTRIRAAAHEVIS